MTMNQLDVLVISRLGVQLLLASPLSFSSADTFLEFRVSVMYDPEGFEKFSLSREGTVISLDKFGHLIQWHDDQSDTILDFGCGPGNVLMDVILPKFQGNFSQVYATDISQPMIEYAAKKYAHAQNVAFQTMDILDVETFLGQNSPVDHVVSTFALHWVPDQDTALKSIFKLLKPGGDFFTVHMQSSTILELYTVMGQNEKWNKYLDNLQQYIPWSQTAEQPEQELRARLANSGFTDIQVTTFPHAIIMKDTDELKRLANSCHPQINNIPEDKLAEYLEEFAACAAERKLLTSHPSGEISFLLNMFVAYGRK